MNEVFVFICGGVRSGKSTFAERFAVSISGRKKRLYYIATAGRDDEEMKQRIDQHREARWKSGMPWITLEYSRSDEFRQGVNFGQDSVVLIDCLTTWLDHELFQNGGDWRQKKYQEEMMGSITETVSEIIESGTSVILVSNDISREITQRGSGVFGYAKMLGRLHQQFVKMCDKAFHLEHGIPVLKKGGGG